MGCGLCPGPCCCCGHSGLSLPTLHPSSPTRHSSRLIPRAQPPDAVLLCDSTELHIIPKPAPTPLPSTELSAVDDPVPAAPVVLRVTIDASMDSIRLGIHTDDLKRLVCPCSCTSELQIPLNSPQIPNAPCLPQLPTRRCTTRLQRPLPSK